MSWLGSIYDKAASAVGIPKVVKTIDPRYTEAKESFKTLSVDTEHIIGSLIQMQTQIQQLSRSCVKLGEDVSSWFSDAPRETKLQGMTVEAVAKQFDNLTTNFLKPRIDPNVIAPLAIFQKEVVRLQGVKDKRKKARKEYDNTKAKLQLSVDKQELPQKVAELESEMRKTKAKYEEFNEDFISSISKLNVQRPEILEKPFRSLVGILSQYMIQLFTEMQKFRTTFPQTVFSPQQPSPIETPGAILNPYASL